MYKRISSERACALSAEDCLQELLVDPAVGLTDSEARNRLQDAGPNELAQEGPEPVWKKFLEKLREPMIALLLGSAVVSLLMRQYDDALSITLVSLPAAITFGPYL